VSSKRVQLVVAGHICLDIIPRFEGGAAALEDVLVPGKLVNVGPAVVSTGGAVSNTGLALHRLGLPTRLMGKIGDDLLGHAILEVIREHDPRLADGMLVAKGVPTSYTVVLNPPGVDRMFLHCPGANDSFGPEDVPYEALRDADLFHFGYPPLMRRMYAQAGRELETLLREVRARGLTISLDMARPDPASEAGRAAWPELLARALRHVDLFLPSLDEILFMLDRPRWEDLERRRAGAELASFVDGQVLTDISGRLLAMGAAVVGLKLGTEGFYLRTTQDAARLGDTGRLGVRDAEAWLGRELLSPCFRVDVVGTTGSGDCTVAGFLAGWAYGLGPEAVMTSAVAVGACNVEAADATSGIPTWRAVCNRVEAGWERREGRLALPGWTWDEREAVWRSPSDRGQAGRTKERGRC